MRRPLRVPRPLRWLLVLVALVLGWAAGSHLQETQARRAVETRQPKATTNPATRPAPGPMTKPGTTTATNP